MGERGKLIAVEGIDGSGKQTQVRLLARELESRGHQVLSTGFPHYDSWFGKMVGQFLNGDFGALESVDPHFTALLYAGDRFEAKPKLEAALNEGNVLLIDRYLGSNLAHQTARVAAGQRDDFLRWIEHLEYGIYGLPREDLVIYLRIPPTEAQKLVTQKSKRAYADAKEDLLEASLRHLQEASEMYDRLAKNSPWVTVECCSAETGSVRPVAEIAREVLAAVEPLLRAGVERPAAHSEKAG